MINKVNGLLGLSAKAGKIVSGTDVVLDKINKGKIKLVIVAFDASDKTKKNIKYYADKSNIPIIIYGTILDNSKAIGEKNKAILGILDSNLANAIQKVIHGGGEFGEN